MLLVLPGTLRPRPCYEGLGTWTGHDAGGQDAEVEDLTYFWAPAISAAYGPEKNLPGADPSREENVLLLVQTEGVVITGTKLEILAMLERARNVIEPLPPSYLG